MLAVAAPVDMFTFPTPALTNAMASGVAGIKDGRVIAYGSAGPVNGMGFDAVPASATMRIQIIIDFIFQNLFIARKVDSNVVLISHR